MNGFYAKTRLLLIGAVCNVAVARGSMAYEPPTSTPSTPAVPARPASVATPSTPPTPAAAPPAIAPNNALGIQPAAPGEHPLAPSIRWAKAAIGDIAKIKDYSATLVKREQIDGVLNEHEYLFVKIRQQPFSVYTYFLGPKKVKGQEALYVDGKNNSELQAHGNGMTHKLIGTLSLNPTGPLAMTGSRYPITQIGVMRLTERLIEVGEADMKHGDCEVKVQSAKINSRDCTCITLLHPEKRKEFLYHLARVYVDNEHKVPIRFEAYEWPREPGGAPELVEEYTYLNLKLENGYTDADFDAKNPNYKF